MIEQFQLSWKLINMPWNAEYDTNIRLILTMKLQISQRINTVWPESYTVYYSVKFGLIDMSSDSVALTLGCTYKQRCPSSYVNIPMHQDVSALYSQKFSFQFQNWPNHHFIYESVYTFTHAMFSDIVYCRCTWTKRREKGHFTWLLVMRTYACLNKDIALSCYIIHTLCHWVGLTHYPRSNSILNSSCADNVISSSE